MLLFIIIILLIYDCYCTPLMKQEITLWKRNTVLEPFLLTSTQDLARRGKWQPTPVFLPRESCGQRSLVGCCPQGCTESDMTEATQQARMHWRRKWQPTPYSCLENPRDGGALWAALCGVAQSRTRLKRLSGSSSSRAETFLFSFVFFHCPLSLLQECAPSMYSLIGFFIDFLIGGKSLYKL